MFPRFVLGPTLAIDTSATGYHHKVQRQMAQMRGTGMNMVGGAEEIEHIRFFWDRWAR